MFSIGVHATPSGSIRLADHNERQYVPWLRHRVGAIGGHYPVLRSSVFCNGLAEHISLHGNLLAGFDLLVELRQIHAVELVDQLESAGVHAAAIDLDWLGWYGAPVAWDEHEDPRITLEHLGMIAARYVGLGVERLVIAGSVPSGMRDRYAAAVGVPLAIVGLRVDEGQETEGLDISLHEERGYVLSE